MNNLNHLINEAIDHEQINHTDEALLINLKQYFEHDAEFYQHYHHGNYQILDAHDIQAFFTSGLKYVQYNKHHLQANDVHKLNITTLYKVFMILEANKRLHQLNQQQQHMLNKLNYFFDWDESRLKTIAQVTKPRIYKLIKPIALLLIPVFLIWQSTWEQPTIYHAAGLFIFGLIILCLLGLVYAQHRYTKSIPAEYKFYSPATVMQLFDHKISGDSPNRIKEELAGFSQ